MPAHERLRLHDTHYIFPSEEIGQSDGGESSRIVGAPGFCLAFQVKRKLLPEEEILGLQGRPRACSLTYELEGVLGKLEKHQNDVHQEVSDQDGTKDAARRMLGANP